jgi:hypothetical protein
MFDSPMEVCLKTSCFPYANFLNLLTEEELAAFPTNVEQSGENFRYVDGTNTEITEDIYTTQALGTIALIVTLQQEVLKGNSGGNKAVMTMKKRKTFQEKSDKTNANEQDMLINIIWCFLYVETRTPTTCKLNHKNKSQGTNIRNQKSPRTCLVSVKLVMIPVTERYKT